MNTLKIEAWYRAVLKYTMPDACLKKYQKPDVQRTTAEKVYVKLEKLGFIVGRPAKVPLLLSRCPLQRACVCC